MQVSAGARSTSNRLFPAGRLLVLRKAQAEEPHYVALEGGKIYLRHLKIPKIAYIYKLRDLILIPYIRYLIYEILFRCCVYYMPGEQADVDELLISSDMASAHMPARYLKAPEARTHGFRSVEALDEAMNLPSPSEVELLGLG